MDTFVGFDSAWTDNPAAPGAICAVRVDHAGTTFCSPRLAGFDDALDLVAKLHDANGFTLIALDQPTIVINEGGSRPAERVAASLIGWLGGGVQPSNRGRTGMFCADAPIWRFLRRLNAAEDPEQARTATKGLFVTEVFPALALASFDDRFFGRLCAPLYNPARRKTFRISDWAKVAEAAARTAREFACEPLAQWCDGAGQMRTPTKSDQDKLDAVICVLIAMHWRLRPREASLMLGDTTNGYIVSPATAQVRVKLTERALLLGVAIE